MGCFPIPDFPKVFILVMQFHTATTTNRPQAMYEALDQMIVISAARIISTPR